MGSTRLSRWLGLSLACLVACLAAYAADRYTEAFDDGFAAWTPINRDLWEIRKEGDNAYLALTRPGKLRPGVRRPSEYVLLSGRRWRDVTISLRAMTLRPTGFKGRDVCIVFGHQDDTHFYYTHLSNDSNNRTHNVIMKVSGDTRGPIMKENRPEPRLSDGWHDVRVSHRADGEIAVWIDDLGTPLMTAHDTDYPAGAVGFGAFDDPAAFDDVVIEGTIVAN